MVTARILLIDDDLKTARQVLPILAREGYQVEHFLPGRAALRQVVMDEPDLVILGIQAQEGGWQVFRRFLPFLDQPVLLLLSSAERLDRVRALDLGADDCLIKPAAPVELVARVRALLRREVSGARDWRRRLFTDGDLTVDLSRREVWLDDEPVRVSATEFQILSCLVQNAGEVVPYERLLFQVWGSQHGRSRSCLKQHIHNLRQKLEPSPDCPRRLVTRWGEGYMLRPISVER